MVADPIRLVKARNGLAATLARDRAWASDDEAFRELVDGGRGLLAALEDVVADPDF